MECRSNCGACCIVPSISSSIPAMPNGKPAYVRCIQLSENNLCKIFDSYLRPCVCKSFKPSFEMCGSTREDAIKYLGSLEKETMP